MAVRLLVRVVRRTPTVHADAAIQSEAREERVREQERYIDVLASVYEPYTVGVWMRASTATRCPLALNSIAAATNLEIAGGALDHRRRAPGQRGRDPLTADQREGETFTFGWLRLLGTVRAWCRSCAMKLLLVVALETVNGVGDKVGV